MNKAFVKESDVEIEDDIPDPAPIPSGKNYMTPAGHKRLQDELRQLKTRDRPEVVQIIEWAAGNGDRSENGDYIYGKRRLREIDKRMAYLSKRLETAEPIDPLTVKSDQVLFGATVTVRDENDVEKTWSIVGIDEADVSKGKISWMSPLANALLKSRVGDVLMFRSPKGVQEVEVVSLVYKAID